MIFYGNYFLESIHTVKIITNIFFYCMLTSHDDVTTITIFKKSQIIKSNTTTILVQTKSFICYDRILAENLPNFFDDEIPTTTTLLI